MGQFALGIRSLLVKTAIFVVMAALLAWALGGTLFPRAETADGPGVVWNDATWRLRASLGGDSPGTIRWSLQRQVGSATPEPWPLRGFDRWVDAAGPIATTDRLYVAFRDNDAETWTLAAIRPEGFETTRLPDRLEVERQFARLRLGLPAQTEGEAAAVRDDVLRAGPPAIGGNEADRGAANEEAGESAGE
jgi:hypothetical protein